MTIKRHKKASRRFGKYIRNLLRLIMAHNEFIPASQFNWGWDTNVESPYYPLTTISEYEPLTMGQIKAIYST